MIKWLKNIFSRKRQTEDLVDETRILEFEFGCKDELNSEKSIKESKSNEYVAWLLHKSIEDHGLKEYKYVKAFIKKFYNSKLDELIVYNIPDDFIYTDEIKKLAKRFIINKYICNNKDLIDLLNGYL